MTNAKAVIDSHNMLHGFSMQMKTINWIGKQAARDRERVIIKLEGLVQFVLQRDLIQIP
jgi:hypothetical protein